MPDAEFLIVDLNIRNNDRTASTFPPVKLVDVQGREYDESSKAIFMPGTFDTFKQLNPGVSSRGYLVFDVPHAQYSLLVSGGFESGEHVLVNLSSLLQRDKATYKPSPSPVQTTNAERPKTISEESGFGSDAENVKPVDSTESGKEGTFSGGTIWTSLTTSNDWNIRQDGDYLYVERLNIPPELKADGVFIRDELRKDPDGKWRGKARSLLPCEERNEIKYCKHELAFEIDLLSDKRIEGVAMDEEQFDCSKCTARRVKQLPFTWIPK